ncbi:hypothetical protein [Rheinheimera metallidurans]|uniref:hypothetical protein n=1 Tax=Rheinheimera metallidurans TaxID=2925781 RepID=UPI00300107A4
MVNESNTVNGTVIVVDFINRSIIAIGKQYNYEPGYSHFNTWYTAVPMDYEFSFNEYLQVQDRINSMFAVQKSWSAIPRQLSVNGTVNAVATVQGLPYPIPPQLCTHFCVDTSSVNKIMDNLDAIRLIGLELNKALITSRTMRYELVIKKLLALKPLIVTVKFSDDTVIDLRYESISFTLPWSILPDTALDANGKPIVPPSNAVHSFNGGYGNGNYSSSLPGLNIVQFRRTGFTNSGAGWKSQLICFISVY